MNTKCDIIRWGMEYCLVGAGGHVSLVNGSEDAGESLSVDRTPETVWSRTANASLEKIEGS